MKQRIFGTWLDGYDAALRDVRRADRAAASPEARAKALARVMKRLPNSATLAHVRPVKRMPR